MTSEREQRQEASGRFRINHVVVVAIDHRIQQAQSSRFYGHSLKKSKTAQPARSPTRKTPKNHHLPQPRLGKGGPQVFHEDNESYV